MDAELMGSAIRYYYTGKSYKQIAQGLKEEYNLEKEPSKATIYEWVRHYTDKPPKTITTDKLKSYMSAVKSVLPESRHMQSEGMRASINNNLSERLQGTVRDRIKTLRGRDSRKTSQRYLDGWVLTYNHFRGHESLRNKTPGQRAKVNPPFYGMGRRGKSRGRASTESAEGAANLLTETEIAGGPSRLAKAAQGAEAVDRGRRCRKRAQGETAAPATQQELGSIISSCCDAAVCA